MQSPPALLHFGLAIFRNTSAFHFVQWKFSNPMAQSPKLSDTCTPGSFSRTPPKK
uniref:Macaca fascicularis brain cDNA clone: QflA-21471, similar to human Dim1-like protein (DLP), mRNA, RefSeq: NM_017853.1 n=1 Tax=Macaca fascicularis TaxID=9541 RepID=I7GD65_MACFA|nr:unnamed protein product [Macaca fascicularis]